MNHLTMYLLLATDKAATSPAVEGQPAAQPAVKLAHPSDTRLSKAQPPGIYQPHGQRARPLYQASYKSGLLKVQGASAATRLEFTASVIANAVGYLVLTSGLLLLLHIAEVGLA